MRRRRRRVLRVLRRVRRHGADGCVVSSAVVVGVLYRGCVLCRRPLPVFPAAVMCRYRPYRQHRLAGLPRAAAELRALRSRSWVRTDIERGCRPTHMEKRSDERYPFSAVVCRATSICRARCSCCLFLVEATSVRRRRFRRSARPPSAQAHAEIRANVSQPAATNQNMVSSGSRLSWMPATSGGALCPQGRRAFYKGPFAAAAASCT